jgi:putative membrane protein insertion efficiency factor
MLRRMLVLPIVLYQRLGSPLLPQSCRFYPPCSEYARRAILKYGPLRGGWLAAKRIARCHPLSVGGYDPPP